MTGKELKPELFKERNELTAFAKHIGQSKQYVTSKFAALRVADDILKQYAAYKKIDEKELLAFAAGPATQHLNISVGESGATYGKGKIDFESEIRSVYKDNVQAHKTLAERGEFILKLLEEREK